jgi:hypothetical protein
VLTASEAQCTNSSGANKGRLRVRLGTYVLQTPLSWPVHRRHAAEMAMNASHNLLRISRRLGRDGTVDPNIYFSLLP